MEPRVHYVIVALFVLALGTITVGVSLWLAFGEVTHDYLTYRVYMNESVSGLFIDAPVKYRGVQVGRVQELDLMPDSPEQVQVTMDIDATVKIKEDTVAKLDVQGVTGIASIELYGGSRESPELKARPGEPYPVIRPGQSLFTRVDSAVSELVGNLNMVANDLHALLTPQTRDRFTHILQNVEQLSAAMAEQRSALGKGIADFSTFTHNAATASEGMPDLFARVDTAATSIQTLADEMTAVTREARAKLGTGGDTLQTLGGSTLPEVEALVTEMRQLTASFQRLSERLEEDPRAVLYGTQLDAPGPGE
ncbi:MAG: MCE family protein [Gammaproteobacteria bacterium]|nr:MCE family protein [Gammaproteobacteria bacterium]